jgi:isoleucyl-tRNA synthetase
VHSWHDTQVHVGVDQHLSCCNDIGQAISNLIHAGDGIPDSLKQQMEGASIAVWTTTPWTMPANLAVAVNGKLQYALVQAEVRSFGWRGALRQELASL